MKKLTKVELININGGSRATAIIAGATCVLALVPMSWVAVALWGPTCLGSVIGTIVD